MVANTLVNELERLPKVAFTIMLNLKLNKMKIKIIYTIIVIYWAIIIGSYFTDSETYQEVALWLFLIGLVASLPFLVKSFYNAFKNTFKK